ncbi:hypothetical protein ASPSYDRAFT_78443 [Aspergillus sydowii CBS 593.65]|uniref:DUF4419 domain-containing protein n=1 Tax=Aspergillus sydowii CBS 593.65 TaxID=1036612 RepID=A0A1L9TLC1_9EURO|nr:uncharacterized protein ASPSYDRAFT_78443 [Aspergillus sydowii CBS 593.65]OJJ60227.1 hypothetical protein ASPSYDRAFT_78443 [Aspergillus sydowii CBS 593.65]
MPVTLTTAKHPPRRWPYPAVSSAQELFQRSCPNEYDQSQRVIQTSFTSHLFETSRVSSSKHGFAWALVDAYSHHHNLTIRPEDVWFSILTQLNFYINANAEDLRSLFVAHEGQKELVTVDVGTIHTVDFGTIALKFTRLIEENVVDEELRDWIMPDFSTTTKSDSVVAAILMMGALQEYFKYKSILCCGIPSVTLLGERADWERMVTKLDKLKQFGDEPARFAQLLRPILNHFVLSFDSPESPEVLDFWSKCAERHGGSGIDQLNGWVSAFIFWDKKGDLLYREQIYPVSSSEFVARNTDLGLGDVLSRWVDTDDIPPGFASVPITVVDNGKRIDAAMVAGLAGIQARSSGAILDKTEETGLDAIQPLSGWWMYEKKGLADTPTNM